MDSISGGLLFAAAAFGSNEFTTLDLSSDGPNDRIAPAIMARIDLPFAGHFLGRRRLFGAFLEGTFENWQSEFLQLLCMVVLTAFLIHKGSVESRDSSDRIERKIENSD